MAMTRRLTGLILALSVMGCQTTRSWNHGCPGIYSGLRFYADQFESLPFDGKVFFTIDAPLSAIVDTLSLPVTAFAKPQRPIEGFVRGCRWAAQD